MNTVAIIQARMGSSRLPEKVVAPIAGKPMLQHVINRVLRASLIDSVIVATTDLAADNAIQTLCCNLGIACFRGSEDDVLDRYYQAAKHYQAERVVRITGDCPLIDPQIIDHVVATFVNGTFDYAANINPPTFPDGLDTEVLSFSALEQSWQEAQLRSEREHVTLYIRNHPEKFVIGNLQHSQDLSNLRWVVDEPQDLEFVRAIFYQLKEKLFLMEDVLRLLNKHPELNLLNTDFSRDEGLLKSLQEDEVFS